METPVLLRIICDVVAMKYKNSETGHQIILYEQLYKKRAHFCSKFFLRRRKGRGQSLPWQLRFGPSFRNGAPLIRLPLLLKQFYKLETFSLYKFVFCYRSSALQSFVQFF